MLKNKSPPTRSPPPPRSAGAANWQLLRQQTRRRGACPHAAASAPARPPPRLDAPPPPTRVVAATYVDVHAHARPPSGRAPAPSPPPTTPREAARPARPKAARDARRRRAAGVGWGASPPRWWRGAAPCSGGLAHTPHTPRGGGMVGFLTTPAALWTPPYGAPQGAPSQPAPPPPPARPQRPTRGRPQPGTRGCNSRGQALLTRRRSLL